MGAQRKVRRSVAPTGGPIQLCLFAADTVTALGVPTQPFAAEPVSTVHPSSLEAVSLSSAPLSPLDPASRPKATTLYAALEEYRDYLVATNMSKHTRDSFGLDLRLLVEHLGDVPLSRVGERELRSFISWARLERHNNATSLRRKIATLKSFFAHLHREQLIPHDPALRLLYPEIYPALPEFLEDYQITALLASASEHLSWHALVRLMLETGLKRDEVVALGWTDVHLDVHAPGTGYLVVRETEQAKRLRSRRLELSADAVSLLYRYRLSETRRDRFFELSPRGVNFIVETCGKRAQLELRSSKLTPQILRETFAVHQMRQMVATERALQQTGMIDEELTRVMDRNDTTLLRLLGLYEASEAVKKYRKLVYGWASHTREGWSFHDL